MLQHRRLHEPGRQPNLDAFVKSPHSISACIAFQNACDLPHLWLTVWQSMSPPPASFCPWYARSLGCCPGALVSGKNCCSTGTHQILRQLLWDSNHVEQGLHDLQAITCSVAPTALRAVAQSLKSHQHLGLKQSAQCL